MENIIKIPKEKIQGKMAEFFRDTRGEPARLLLAYAFLKDWVDHYDDFPQEEETTTCQQSHRERY